MGFMIEEPLEITREIAEYMYETGSELNKLYGGLYNFENFNIFKYIRKGGRLTLCKKDGEYYGLMLARLTRSVWDNDVKIFQQDTLYSSHPKATWLLLRDFIDYGKRNADHIITMIGSGTNIKEGSLKRQGFKKLETLYRLEV